MPPTKTARKVRKKISNADVLESLELQTSNRKKKKKKKISHCEWIHDNVTDFINSRPIARSDLLQNLPDTLTEEEKLQIVNLIPTEIVDLFLVIDNLNERFTEAQQEELLTIVRSSPEEMKDACDPPQQKVSASEETPFVADAVVSYDGDMTGMEMDPTNKEDNGTEPRPQNVPSFTLRSTKHNDIAMNSTVDIKHVMNGGAISPSTENARNGLVSLPKIRLELS